MPTSSSERPIFSTITQAFLHQVATQPNTLGFFTRDPQKGSWHGMSWKQYYELSRDLSLGLMSLGIKDQEHVALISNTRLEWLALDMAILGAKAITVPVYASSTAEEMVYILGHSEAKYVFVEDGQQLDKILPSLKDLKQIEKIILIDAKNPKLIAQNPKILTLQALKELGRQNRNPAQYDENLKSLKPEDLFTICYTSGTTGIPKGVELTHDNLASIMEDSEKLLGMHISSKDRTLAFLPCSHVLGRVENMCAYQFGWQIYFAESIEKLLSNMAEVKPTVLWGVPRIFEKAAQRIKAKAEESSPLKKALFYWAVETGKAYYEKVAQHSPLTFSDKAQFAVARRLVLNSIYARFGGKVRFCIVGGAPMPKKVGEFMRIIGIHVLEGYGLTETCAPVALNPYDDTRYGTIGKPFPDVSVKIAPDGELLLKSRKVFRGYFKNPEATAAVMDDQGWFHTGDIAVLDEDGYLTITDRKKDLIATSGGKKIAPQKIEKLAKTYKYISQFVVHGERRNYLTALICLDKEEIIKYAKKNHILFSEYKDLLKNEKIIRLVQKSIDDLNQSLASYESIKKFTLLPQEFSIETGELTPSLKVKRKFCDEKYKQELDAMYQDS